MSDSPCADAGDDGEVVRPVQPVNTDHALTTPIGANQRHQRVSSMTNECIIDVPVPGPHGLDLDMAQGRSFCTCDAKKLVCLDAHSGSILAQLDLSGHPDVVFFNPALNHLCVTIGNPGIIGAFDTETTQLIESVNTESGAHTIAFNPKANKVYAFLPQSHQASVYVVHPI